MSKKATEFQKREMSKMYRGKEIFKPLNTGWVDERVACVREWVANIFFYRKGDTTIMIDAGYNYDRLAEKMGWLGIDPQSIRHILITHQDTDHVGAVEADSPGLFRSAKLYIGEIENRYLTGEVRRKVIYHLYKLPQVTINNEKVLLHDGETFEIDGIKIECFLVPGHTWGHMVYLIDDKYLFTGDTLWFGADGGYSFISSLAESNKLAVKSLAALEQKLQSRDLHPLFLTGHTGWTDNFEFAFAIRTSFAHRSKSEFPTPPRLMTLMMNRTIRKKWQRVGSSRGWGDEGLFLRRRKCPGHPTASRHLLPLEGQFWTGHSAAVGQVSRPLRQLRWLR